MSPKRLSGQGGQNGDPEGVPTGVDNLVAVVLFFWVMLYSEIASESGLMNGFPFHSNRALNLASQES